MNILITLQWILSGIIIALLYYRLVSPFLKTSKQDKPSDKVFRIYHENACHYNCNECPLKDLCLDHVIKNKYWAISTLDKRDLAEIWLIQNDYICREEV